MVIISLLGGAMMADGGWRGGAIVNVVNFGQNGTELIVEGMFCEFGGRRDAEGLRRVRGKIFEAIQRRK